MKSFPAYILVYFASILFAAPMLLAQSAIPVETNENVTTTIFFPSNIAKVVPPATNFNFHYEKTARIGLLKGSKGRPSNLLVITDDGFAYSFAIRYAEEIEKFNFILTTDQAVSQTDPSKTVSPIAAANQDNNGKTSTGTTDVSSIPDETDGNSSNSDNETPASQDTDDGNLTKQVKIDNTTIDTLIRQNKDLPPQSSDSNGWENEDDDLYDSDREEYYRIFCENNYLQKTILKRSFKKNKKIAVRLNNILVDRNEKYFVLQIENNSKKEFAVGGLGFFRKTGIGQLEKIMTPLYSFNLQETIDPQSVNEVVYVFKNFNIGGKERINIALTDANSDNGVVLSMDNLIINSASN